MPNNFIDQGTLNRTATAVNVIALPELNIISSNMGENFVTMSPENDAGLLLNTGTGGVASGEPYIKYTVAIDLLRSQSLANDWFNQMQFLCTIGAVTFTPDATPWQKITLLNCIIKNVVPGAYDGKTPEVPLTIQGYLPVNSAQWNL